MLRRCARAAPLALALLGACATDPPPPSLPGSPPPPPVLDGAGEGAGEAPARLVLHRSGGGPDIDLATLRGHVVLVWVFATWSMPCQAELRQIERLAAAYRDRGLEVVGVALDREGDRLVSTYVRTLGVTFPVGLGGELLEGGTALGRIDEVPTTLLVDREGRVRERVGALDPSALARRIEALL